MLSFIYGIIDEIKEVCFSINHSYVRLPLFAAEIDLNPHFFKMIGVDGYCIEKEWLSISTDEMSCSIYKSSRPLKEKQIAFRELHRLYQFYQAQPDTIKRICIFPTKPTAPTGNKQKDAYKKAATINHERLHAQITEYTLDWFELVHVILGEKYPEDWYDLTECIMNVPIHKNMLKRYGEEWLIWIIVNEILARVAAVLHAPIAFREIVATQQLYENPQLMLKVASNIEQEYGSTEGFIKMANEMFIFQLPQGA